MGILGIGLALAMLMALSFRGWSILLLAPALVAALFAGEHLVHFKLNQLSLSY